MPSARPDGARIEACFAPCPRGLEPALAEELVELAVSGTDEVAGGVHFKGSWADVYRINLRSRIASRVLVRVAQARYRTDEDIHRLARSIDWTRWFNASQTLRVDVTAGSGRSRSPLRSLEFVTLRIKDAVCDRFREITGERPSVATVQPDVRVFAYLDATTCTLYLDSSGEPLFKRGWRTEVGEAPLRENLAAGILRLAGWKPGIALLDPMCGSGTFVAEAAQAASGIAPGAMRDFGFERLKNFDAASWQSTRSGARGASNADALALLRASDVSGDAVLQTRANLLRAGVSPDASEAIAPRQIDARHVKPHAATGILVTNPPYGERIGIRGERAMGREIDAAGDPLAGFLAEFGDTLKQRFAGWQAHILSSDLQLQRSLHLAPDRRTPLFNGAIECRLYRFRMVEGKR